MMAAMDAPDRVVSVNGLQLAVDDHPPGAGADPDALPLVLVHGFTGGRVDWADVIGPLAEDRRVVAWDHRGHADSTNTGDPASYTFDRLVDDMVGVLAALALDRFHLLGHSMGGVVAQRYVLAHPAPVASLVLMDTAGSAMSGISADFLDTVVTTGRTEGMGAAAAGLRRLLEGAPMSEQDRERTIERMTFKLSTMDVEAFAALGAELGEYPSMLERLGEGVRVPMTVIVGENDTGLRPAADALHAAVAGSALVVIPDAAHSPQEENPEAWLAAVRAHLARSD
jgi:pimeloyl-ACP methyl ester carboxylesterase